MFLCLAAQRVWGCWGEEGWEGPGEPFPERQIQEGRVLSAELLLL